ncbi:MAG: chemotaxis protein CheA [Spirochaetales bacterium]|nr:chemotaxis protein CheA [Spirochaetales bacterium]
MAPERGRTEVDDQRLLRAFLEEAGDYLERLNAALLELERDASNRELVHEIFRLTHSLKSEFAVFGFGKLSLLAHRLEDVFEKVRSGETAMSRALMDAIFTASDLLHEVMGRITRGEGEGEVDSAGLLAELEALAGLGPRGPDAGSGLRGAGPAEARELSLSGIERFRVLEALDRGQRVYRVDLELDPEAQMPYARAYLVFNNLESAVNVIKTAPDLSAPDLSAPAENDQRYGRFAVLFATDANAEQVRGYWDVDEVHETNLRSWSWDDIGESGLGVDQASDGVYPGAEAALAAARAGRGRPERRQPAEGSRASVESTSVRVDTKKLNEMWQLVGDLVTWKARLSGLSDTLLGIEEAGHLREETEQVRDSLERIAAGMQEAIMETSMVPISLLFSKFPRLVRDLSRKLGKEVRLEIDGQDTEIDRSFVEVLSDPLTHIIRNSLDHGIERPPERLAAGKPASGTVSISAQQLGGRIVIEVADDGRGLDVEKIRRKAAAAPEVSDEEVIQNIFTPGFSTKEGVTDLSGRGVGMDVVATRIRGDLKGDVQVKTEPGRGTRIAIFLPLSLAILEALIIRCRSSFYAVAVRDIEETVKVRLQAGLRGETVRYREADIPVLRLEGLLYRSAAPPAGRTREARPADIPGESVGEEGDSLLEASGVSPEVEDSEYNGVVIRQKGRAVCLVVDQLVEEQDVVIKPVPDLLNNTGLFSGISVLGDGRILFVLDTARLAEIA